MKRVNCILLIDDNPGDNEYHSYIIRKANVCNHINVALDGEKGLSYLKKIVEQDQSESFPVPDLIFLDINMPRVNGFEFIKEYHNLEIMQIYKVVIIMLTTSINPDDKKIANSIKEISEFQNKPLTVEAVQTVIEKYF